MICGCINAQCRGPCSVTTTGCPFYASFSMAALCPPLLFFGPLRYGWSAGTCKQRLSLYETRHGERSRNLSEGEQGLVVFGRWRGDPWRTPKETAQCRWGARGCWIGWWEQREESNEEWRMCQKEDWKPATSWVARVSNSRTVLVFRSENNTEWLYK